VTAGEGAREAIRAFRVGLSQDVRGKALLRAYAWGYLESACEGVSHSREDLREIARALNEEVEELCD
jgi:hypothetical protein